MAAAIGTTGVLGDPHRWLAKRQPAFSSRPFHGRGCCHTLDVAPHWPALGGANLHRLNASCRARAGGERGGVPRDGIVPSLPASILAESPIGNPSGRDTREKKCIYQIGKPLSSLPPSHPSQLQPNPVLCLVRDVPVHPPTLPFNYACCTCCLLLLNVSRPFILFPPTHTPSLMSGLN